MKRKILYVHDPRQKRSLIAKARSHKLQIIQAMDDSEAVSALQNGAPPCAVVCDLPLQDLDLESFIDSLRSTGNDSGLPVILLAGHWSAEHKVRAQRAGATACLEGPLSIDVIEEELGLDFGSNGRDSVAMRIRPVPFGKRLFDLAVAGALLFVLSPLILLVALQIKITSRGPAIVGHKRLGMGYHLFNLYRFRTRPLDSSAGASMPKKLHLSSSNSLFNIHCPDCIRAQQACSPLYVHNGDIICENQLVSRSGGIFETTEAAADAEPTRLGRFLERTGLAGVPQLVNVLKGDLSLVGIRPLSPDEAAMLSPAEWRVRFLAPAGLVGIWRIAERQELAMPDIVYAESRSFKRDLAILGRVLLCAGPGL